MAGATQARFAAAVLDPAMPVPAGILSARGVADPLRFAIYRNTVHVGLVDALARAFPVVRALVGDAFFRAMARVHVAACKPASPVLLHYGDAFPGFVEGFAPAAGLPYLADVARLERARHEAYHAAEATPLAAAAVAGERPDRLAGARFEPHPAVRLVASAYAVGSIWAAHQAGPAMARVDAGRVETVLVTRPDAAVHTTILPACDLPFVRHLLAGEPLAVAAGRAGADDGFDAGRALAGLLALGALGAFHPSTGEDQP